jgi:hypothetical protein
MAALFVAASAAGSRQPVIARSDVVMVLPILVPVAVRAV